MAPESLTDRKYSVKTDVWSFGILCWEVFTFGAKPFKDLTNDMAVTAILRGARPPQPENVSSEMYVS